MREYRDQAFRNKGGGMADALSRRQVRGLSHRVVAALQLASLFVALGSWTLACGMEEENVATTMSGSQRTLELTCENPEVVPVFANVPKLFRPDHVTYSEPVTIASEVSSDVQACLVVSTRVDGHGKACSVGVDCTQTPDAPECVIDEQRCQANERVTFFLVKDGVNVELGTTEDCNGADENCRDCGPYEFCATVESGSYELVAQHVDPIREPGETPESVSVLPATYNLCPACGEEVCNRVDDDCDGEIDEPIPCEGECGPGEAICQPDGSRLCQAPAAKRLLSSLYLRNWQANPEQTQWSTTYVANPSDKEAKVDIKVYRPDGSTLGEYSVQLPAKGWYNSYLTQQWNSIPLTDPANQRSAGWFEVSSCEDIIGSHRLVWRDGHSEDAPIVEIEDESLQAGTTELVSSLYLRNWPADTSGQTQWSTVYIANPNATAVDAAISVYALTGALLGSYTVNIPAFGWYNSYLTSVWNNIPLSDPANQRSAGWFKVSATAPIVASHRLHRRSGTTEQARLVMADDEPLTPTSEHLVSSIYLRNWPSTSQGITRWSTLHLANPNDTAVNVTISAYSADSQQLLASYDVTVPAFGWYNSYRTPQWEAIPPSDTTRQRSIGWFDVHATAPIVASHRLTYRAGNTSTSELKQAQDETMVVPGMRKRASLYLRSWPTPGVGFQWSNILIANPGSSAVTAQISVYGIEGTPIGSLAINIPAHGFYNSYLRPEWTSLPWNFPDQGASAGWLQILADGPIATGHRLSIRPSNTDETSDVLLDEDEVLVP